MNLDTGTPIQGASRQRWKSKSASALIEELIDEYGGDVDDTACCAAALEAFRDMMFNDEAARAQYLDPVLDSFFTKTVGTLRRAATKKRTPRGAAFQQKAAPETPPASETSTAPEPLHKPPAAESATPEASPSEATSPEAAAQVEAAVQRTAQQREARAKAREEIKQSLARRYLEMLTPIGKTLGDCSREDCIDLSLKVGPWFGRIAACLNPGEIVRTRLDDDALGRLYA
jgi:hypothetical protein